MHMSEEQKSHDGVLYREIEFVTDEGVTLRADEYEPSREAATTCPHPVLLVHGGGQTRKAWEGTAVRLARHGHRVISLDQRGHGASTWAGNYFLSSFAKDLHSVVSQLSNCVIVGASLGGLAALISEGEMTPSARAVVLVDIAPRMEPAGAQRVIDFMTNTLDGFATLEEAARAVAAYQPHRARSAKVSEASDGGKGRAAALSGLRKNLRLDPDGRYRWHWDPRFLSHATSPHFVSEGSEYHDPGWDGEVTGDTVGEDDSRLSGLTDQQRRDIKYLDQRLQDAARSLRCPTLLIRGQMSDLISPDSVEEFIGLVPHAEFVNVEKAHHMVAGDRNDVFTEAVADFLSRVD